MDFNYCAGCGNRVMTSIRICPSCGERNFSPNPTIAQQPQQQSQQQPQQQPQQQSFIQAGNQVKGIGTGVLLFSSMIIFMIWGVAQFIAGYAGIEAYAGAGWAVTAIIFSLLFRFTLPVTVGSFYGAMVVWNWPWYLALLFAAPGLALVAPGVLALILSTFKLR